MEQELSNESNKDGELIKCSKCGFPLFRQVIGKTTKRIERLSSERRPYTEKFRAEALEDGHLKIPIDGECPQCKKPYTISLITEDLLGVTFRCKGEIFEMINGKKKQIIKKGSRKRYKIYMKLN